MSFPRLLTSTASVWVRGPAATSTDELGNPVEDVALFAEEYPVHLSTAGGQELTEGRETVVFDFDAVIGPNDAGELPALDASDRVDVDGESYEVVGPPARLDSPRGPHHVEARLRKVTG